MNVIARNFIQGKARSNRHGLVSTEAVTGAAKGADITSVITKSTAIDPALKKGSADYAAINAGNPTMATEA